MCEGGAVVAAAAGVVRGEGGGEGGGETAWAGESWTGEARGGGGRGGQGRGDAVRQLYVALPCQTAIISTSFSISRLENGYVCGG